MADMSGDHVTRPAAGVPFGHEVNAGPRTDAPTRDSPADRVARLAVYGTLQPGQPNHHQLTGLVGHWIPGRVTGRLFSEGWGAALGFPALVLDPAGPWVEVQILQSEDLPQHWDRLDAFEGRGYRRVVCTADTEHGALDTHIYVLAGEPSEGPAPQ
jgi:gamma-glutamylcyclotransferase (GGCT)/AIG2-like uncharacterized protein YtfP